MSDSRGLSPVVQDCNRQLSEEVESITGTEREMF